MAGTLSAILATTAAAGSSSCTPFPPDAPEGNAASGPARDSASAQGAGAENGPPCDPNAAFGPASLVAGLDLATTMALSVSGVRLSPDLNIAYFAAAFPGDVSLVDLYTASRIDPKSAFSGPVLIPGLSVPGTQQFDPSVSGDGRTLIFSRGQPSGNSAAHLYSATRELPYPFMDVQPMGTVDDPGTALDESPFLREDGLVLYFASSRVPANSTDIYNAARGDGGFMAPTPVTELNTANSELSPAVTPDDLTIFFASDRTDGRAQGQYDIWMGTRSSTAEMFSSVRDVGEVNSPALELPTFITRDGCTLYFSSTRDGGLQPYVATKRRAP
jgi:hypothetical protein